MGKPRFLAENLWNPVRFGDHSISANEESDGNEAFHVGDGRRNRTSFWTPTTNNSEATIQVKCDRPRSADVLVIDRDSNLDGETVHLECSDDNFSSTETIFTVTLPSNSTPNQDISDGAKMEDGAWCRSFSSRVATYWRLRIDAMGSGLKPEIVGLYLGTSWQPNLLIDTPWGWGDSQLQSDRVTSDAGWRGRSNFSEARRRTFTVKLSSFSEFSSARYHTRGLYWRGDPMWIWPDETQAERGWCAMVPDGRHRWQKGQDRWAFMQTDLEAREHQPVLR